jgi:hypothetical protein
MNDNREPDSGREQDSARSTSGGGLGQGRETAAGMPDDQLQEKGRPGKGMGGTSDGGNTGARSDQRAQGPAPSTTTSDVRPSRAGTPARSGGSGIDLGDRNDPSLDPASSGAEWSRNRGMGPENDKKQDAENPGSDPV